MANGWSRGFQGRRGTSDGSASVWPLQFRLPAGTHGFRAVRIEKAPTRCYFNTDSLQWRPHKSDIKAAAVTADGDSRVVFIFRSILRLSLPA